jgi:hypothetical protein
VTGEPPLFDGGVNEIVASVFPTATDKTVGASGTVEGVAAAKSSDSNDVPMPFVAVTANL